MGAHLSEPVTTKETESGSDDRMEYGATAMQGWRLDQEDAHNVILELEDGVSLFAVYDGHGGPEVAQYAAKTFPPYLIATPHWKNGEFGKALEESFVNFDATLNTEEVRKELKKLADENDSTAGGDGDDVESDEDRAALIEEAHLPINEVLQRYGFTVGGPNTPVVVGKKRKRKTKRTFRSGEDEDSDDETESEPIGNKEEDANKLVSAENVSENCAMEEPTKTTDSATPKAEEQPAAARSIDKPGLEEKENQADTCPDVVTDAKTCVVKATGEKRELEKAPTPPGADENPVLASPKAKRRREDDDVTEAGVVSPGSADPEVPNGDDASKSTENGEESGKSKGKGLVKKQRSDSDKAAELLPSGDEEDGDQDFEMSMEQIDGTDSEDGDDEDETDEEEETTTDEDDTSDTSSGEEAGEVDDEDGSGIPFPFGNGVHKHGVDSGTTACVAVIRNNTLYVANVGDSRCVLSRGGKAIDLSIDHKPEDESERQRIEKAGGRVTEDFRVNGGLNMSRALGDFCYKQNNDLPLSEQMISPVPDVVVQSLTPEDDFVVLACDGIWNSLSSQETIDFVKKRMDNPEASLVKIANELCDHCLAPNAMGDGTGCDNMTVIIIKLRLFVEKKSTALTSANFGSEETLPVPKDHSEAQSTATTGSNDSKQSLPSPAEKEDQKHSLQNGIASDSPPAIETATIVENGVPDTVAADSKPVSGEKLGVHKQGAGEKTPLSPKNVVVNGVDTTSDA